MSSEPQQEPAPYHMSERVGRNEPPAQERQAGGHRWHVHEWGTQVVRGYNGQDFLKCAYCGWEATANEWAIYWQGVADAAATNRNWAERIERAKEAREGGRILREAKAARERTDEQQH